MPNTDTVDALIATLPAEQGTLPPQLAGGTETKEIESRHMIQVPKDYAALVLNQQFTPHLCGRNWGKLSLQTMPEVCQHLLDWMALVLPQQINLGVDDKEDREAPATYLGPMTEVLTVLAGDDVLQAHHWAVLHWDLPALDATCMGPANQM